MKFGHLIEYNVRVFFSENHVENEAQRLVPDLFLKKWLIWGKSKWAAPLLWWLFPNLDM